MAQQDPIERLLALPEDQQRHILGQMNPDQLNTIRSKIQERTSGKRPEFKPVPNVGRAVNPAKNLVSTPIPESTLGSRTREFAIGALEPFTLPNLLQTIKTGGHAAFMGLMGKPGEAEEFAKGLFTAPFQPLGEAYQAIKAGDYDRLAHAGGGILSQTTPAVYGAVETAGKIAPDIGDLRTQARNIAQRATGQTAADTSAKVFDKYAEEVKEVPGKQRVAKEAAEAKTAEKQTRENEITAERNKKAALAAKAKNEAAQVKYQQQVKTAEEEAATKTAEQQGQFEKTQQFQLDSKRLGERVNDLNSKLKLEADEKYQAVHDATAADEGESLADAAKQAKAFIKGSSENIKQLREVLAGSEGEAFVSEEGGTFNQAQGHPLQKILEGEDPLAEQSKYKFDDINGFKQELDAKLGAGNLLPDVYNALKSFRQSLAQAANTIASRNGVGEQLQEANKFYRSWKELFTDNARNQSAIGDILNRVKNRTTNPEFYHEPVTKGKASEVAIDRLKNLPTRYSAEANAIADLSKQLRDRYNVGEKPSSYLGERPSRVPAVDVTPPTPIGTRPASPRTIKPATPKEVPTPEEPNVAKIIKDRAEAVGAQGRGMQKISSYDIRRLGLPVLGGLVAGHPLAGLVTGVGIEALTKGTGYLLDIDRVKNFIAAPTEADVAAAERLPEPARSNVVNGLRQIIDQEKSAGRPVKVSPRVVRLLSGVGIANAPVANRGEAMELLGK